jgi:curli biogenesis system outer membrane secretion channel CsgG
MKKRLVSLAAVCAVSMCLAHALLYLPAAAQEEEVPAAEGQASLSRSDEASGNDAQADATAASWRKRIAVVSFESPYEYMGTGLSGGITDMMTTALVRSRSLDVVEREQLEKILSEHDLAAQGLLDPETAAQAGKILGVDYILGGKITEFGEKTSRTGAGAILGPLAGVDVKKGTARVKMDVRLIEVETGRVLLADTGVGEEKESGLTIVAGDLHHWLAGVRFDTDEWNESKLGKASRKAVDQVIEKITQFFPPQARVIAVLGDGGKGTSFLLDVGAFAGYKAGDEFVLYEVSEIKDDSGKVIWREKKQAGTAEITEVQNEASRAVLTSIGGRVEKGMMAIPKAWEDRKSSDGTGDDSDG